MAALLEEIRLRKDYIGENVSTIYFGGGTPSLLDSSEIAALLALCKETFLVDKDAEITLEANPDDITLQRLEEWKSTGINRLSIGVQSFYDEDLKWMNRAHTAMQARENLALAIAMFPNITIDLIYGTPGLTDEKWKQNVKTAIEMGIPHLSCYALTVEPKTPLQKMIAQQQSVDVDPARQSEQFLMLMEWLADAGYEHYEISNFAKPGWRSRHNSSYWQGKNYIGIGPSAHSFDQTSRQWNVANNQQYIMAISEGRIPFEKEVLTHVQRANEYIMTSLRTMEGLHLKNVLPEQEMQLIKVSEKYINSNLMILQDQKLILTREGRLLADGIAAELFFEDNTGRKER